MKGYTNVGFTAEQAKLLKTRFDLVKNLAELYALEALVETVSLRMVLEAKGILTAEEVNDARKAVEERRRDFIDLESMYDPEYKKALGHIDEFLRRRRAADGDSGTQPEA